MGSEKTPVILANNLPVGITEVEILRKCAVFGVSSIALVTKGTVSLESILRRFSTLSR